MKFLAILASAVVCAASEEVKVANLRPAYFASAPYAASLVPAPYAYAPGYVAGAPVVTAAAPAVVSAPIQTSYHARDEFGNVNYGYSDINSVKQESGNVHQGVQGTFQYVDPEAKLQTVNYVADGLGFRILSDTRTPVAPVYAAESPVFTGVAPEPVKDTEDVAAAKAKFLEEFNKIAEERKHTVAKRSPLSDPQVVYGYNSLPYAYGAGYHTPLLSYHSYRYPTQYYAGYGPTAYLHY